MSQFDEKLRRYLDAVRPAGHAGRRSLFQDFVRDAFGIPLADYQLEERVFGGRVDALLGNLVFEFKTSLVRELEDAEVQLKRYITDLSKTHPGTAYTGVATDGVLFKLYAPVWDGGTATALDPVGELDCAKRSREPDIVRLWLDSLLAHFRDTQLPPTTQNVVAHVGPNSPAFRTASIALHSLYREVRDEVRAKFQQWKKHLGLVYGEESDDPNLFVKHTFLATVAKLVVYLRFDRHSLPIDQDRLAHVTTGEYFRASGITNFIEEDFFTWFLHPSVAQRGLAVATHLANTLAAFDFRQAQEDTLKALYEGLVDPEARHDLGEYYTPDWLAEYMLHQMLKLPDNPELSLLDPSCGSGTFLFTAVRAKKRALVARGLSPAEATKLILDSVQGVDIHPLAVTVSRANYLLALGELVEGHHPPLALPVFLANSIRLPRSTVEDSEHGPLEDVFTEQETDHFFQLPRDLTAQPDLLDRAVDTMRGFVKEPNEENALRGFAIAARHLGLGPFAVATLSETLRRLRELDAKGDDTIWPFILKNTFKPVFLAQRKFDALVGNPPWLSFRYIKNPRYASFIRQRVLRDYKLLGRGKGHLFTHMELATLFFVAATDIYLREGGSIAFVMPRAIMTADQHAEFTRFLYSAPNLHEVRFRVLSIADLEGVSPLFKVPSCVLLAQKGGDTAFPIPGLRFSGSLPAKDIPWTGAAPHITIEEAPLSRVEGKLLPQGRTKRYLGKSHYRDKFFEGASVGPRQLWFVQLEETPLGFNPEWPPLETNEEVAAQAKAPWDQVRLRGNVEADFIYATLLGGDVLPFGHLPLRPVVLPVAQPAVAGGDRPILVDRAWALESGYIGLRDWLDSVDRAWAEHAKRDENGQLKATALGWLDWRRKLSKQLVSRQFKVLYNKSGTNLAAAVLDTSQLGALEAGALRIMPQGFVAEHTTYYYETVSADEASYVAAVLNSPLIDQLIKPMQARGQWGERHIHQRPLDLGWPKFNPKVRSHRELVRLGQECHQVVAAALPELAGKYRSVGKLRTEIRHLLKDKLAEINRLVYHILESA